MKKTIKEPEPEASKKASKKAAVEVPETIVKGKPRSGRLKKEAVKDAAEKEAKPKDVIIQSPSEPQSKPHAPVILENKIVYPDGSEVSIKPGLSEILKGEPAEQPATITNMKDIAEEIKTVVEKPVEPEPIFTKITDEAKHIEEEAVDKAKGTWEKVKGVFHFTIPTKVLVIAAIIFCTVGGIYILCRALETKAQQERSATVKAKMDELAKKLVEVSGEITKGEAKVYVDQETAEAYKNDRVAFENSMKSKRLVNLNEHDEVQNKIDSAHNMDAIRNLIDTILTIKAQ